MFVIPTVTYAISAQWDLDPTSGDWNTAANWTPNEVPNGPADIATFGLSHTSDVSISANTEVNGITFTSAATNPYTITAGPGLTLTISGVGVTNNSEISQNFLTTADASRNVGTIVFSNSATAGSNFIRNDGGSTNFLNGSTAGDAGISNMDGGSTNFFNGSTAGGAGISNVDGGSTNFFNRSTAGNAGFSNEGGSTNFFNRSTAGNARISIEGESSSVQFLNRSTAGSAHISSGNSGEGGSINFFDRSTAGSATIDCFFGSAITFFNSSTAGNSTIEAVFGSSTVFFADHSTAGTAHVVIGDSSFLQITSSAGSAFLDSAGFINFYGTAGSATVRSIGPGIISFYGSSKGGTSAIELVFYPNFDFGAELDISAHDAPGVTIGSLQGSENTFVGLGANNLTVGSNNLSTAFSGEIAGTGGSLTKIGSGTLILSGANTYTGDTNVNRGVLQVDGSITSNTFVNRAGTLAGTGTINGNVTNNGRVSPGSAGAPGMLTIVHNYTQAQYATLMIQIAGMSPDQFSVLNVLGNVNLSGYLDPVLLNGFVPTIGDSFIFLNYASLTGGFSYIKHQIFDNGMLQWSVIYEANHAILTVGPNTIPDQGSTFLLLTFGLLGLVAYRRQLLPKRS
jgi:autotransporter-associated beta strand protein